MVSRELERGEAFALTGWAVRDGQAVFGFRDARHGPFEERVWFEDAPFPDEPDPGLSRLLDLTHVALGVSTYKLAAARLIDLPALTPAGRSFARRLYTDGLAEFFVRADLPYPPGSELRFAGEAEAGIEASALREGPPDGATLVAFGGGKDSYVARAIVEAAGETPRLVSVVMADPVRDVLTATAPTPVTFLRRSLDPRMLAADGFSGHVPITAINTMVLTLYGRLTGARAVVFANERSADEPTLQLGAVAANHQDSKGSVMERLMAAAVAEADARAPRPFSILRPYSELWIARAFTRLGEGPRGRFTSCNRNFRLAGDAERRWCGSCAKCAFTSLVMSPWLDEASHVHAFGARFLDAEPLQPYFAALLGLTETKPWDCVGTIDECRAALSRLAESDVWGGTEAVRRHYRAVLERTDEDGLATAWAEALQPSAAPGTPQHYQAAAARWG